MRKIKFLLAAISIITLGLLFNTIESKATTIDTLKSNGNYANGNVQYTVSGSDEVAINSAIVEASEQGIKEGKQAIVYLPKGTYNLNDRVLVLSNVYILCQDGVTINRTKSSDKKIFQLGGTQRGVFVAAKNVTIDGGTLNGNGGLDSTIHMQEANNITIKNLIIKENNAGKQGINIISSKNVKVDNCKISGNVKNGIAVSTNSTATLNKVTVSNNKERGIYISAKSNVTITNSNVTSNNLFGISADNSTLNMSGSNVITNNLIHGIHITNGSSAKITGVTVKNNGIEANGVKNNGKLGSSHGICISNKGSLTLTNSTIIDNAWNGVSASGESKVDIHDNYFSGHGCGMINGRPIQYGDDCGHGVGVSMGSTGDVYDNIIEKNLGCGISVSYRAKANIYRNTITTSGRHAIGLTRGAYVNVYANTIKNNNYNGILISVGSSGDIHDNKVIDNNKVNGISVMDTSTCNIKNNNIRNNGQHGIGLGAGKEWSEYEPATDAKGNTDESKKGTPKLQGSSATIQKNTITGNKKHGISVATICKATIKNKNNITKNGANGIAIQGSSNANIFGSNTISKNKSNGIYVADKGTQVKIESNILKQNKETAIYVKNNSKATSIQKNIIANNGQYGIRLYKATAKKIKKNTLSNPTATYEIYINANSKSNVGSMKTVQINQLKKNAKKIKGIATDGLKVTTKIDNKKYSAKVKKSNYSIKLSKKLKKGYKVIIKTEDMAKNVASNQVIVE